MSVLGNFLTSIFRVWKINVNNRKLATKPQLVATFHYSEQKPTPVSSRPFALFYRSRTLWIALQIICFVALAIWTVHNYVAVIRSL